MSKIKPKSKPKSKSKSKARRYRKKKRLTVSDILDKVKNGGVGSLTPQERVVLSKLRQMRGQAPADGTSLGAIPARRGPGRPVLRVIEGADPGAVPAAAARTLEEILDPDTLLPEIAEGILSEFRRGGGIAKMKAAEMILLLQEKFVPISSKTLEIDIQVG